MSGPAWIKGSGGGAASTTFPFTNKSGAYVIDNTDCVINCTANTFTVTLPTAVGVEGQFFIVKNSGTGIVTVDGDGSETIDGQANKKLAVQYESITVVSNGVNWVVV